MCRQTPRSVGCGQLQETSRSAPPRVSETLKVSLSWTVEVTRSLEPPVSTTRPSWTSSVPRRRISAGTNWEAREIRDTGAFGRSGAAGLGVVARSVKARAPSGTSGSRCGPTLERGLPNLFHFRP